MLQERILDGWMSIRGRASFMDELGCWMDELSWMKGLTCSTSSVATVDRRAFGEAFKMNELSKRGR